MSLFHKKIIKKIPKVLVVGSTPDYIHWIRTRCPERALFLTSPEIRKTAFEPTPRLHEEILVDLNCTDTTMKALYRHLDAHNISITGVACFDCEYLETASIIAQALNLDFPTIEAIRQCRDKYISKQIWQKKSLPCPEAAMVDNVEDAVHLLNECSQGIVLKPFYGSGSELVFKCTTEEECAESFQLLKRGLESRKTAPLFCKHSSQDHLMLGEAFVPGPEYSCDILVSPHRSAILRITQKIKPALGPFGTTSGYILPGKLPPTIRLSSLESQLIKSARALGITKGICMADFVIHGTTPTLIELTPRPGGDCLPQLLLEAMNFDMLRFTLDIAENKSVHLPGLNSISPHIGLRILARKPGIFRGIQTQDIQGEERIKKIEIYRKPGHNVTMPPMDYDSWLLGHMIIKPDNLHNVETQCLLMSKRLKVNIE